MSAATSSAATTAAPSGGGGGNNNNAILIGALVGGVGGGLLLIGIAVWAVRRNRQPSSIMVDEYVKHFDARHATMSAELDPAHPHDLGALMDRELSQPMML